MWRSRMFWRLFGASGVLLLACIGLSGWLIVHRVEQHYLQQIEDNLSSKAILVREVIRDRQNVPAAREKRVRELGREIATRITLIAADGHVQADTHEDPRRMDNHGRRPEVLAAQEHGWGTATRFSDTLRLPMMYRALRTNGRKGMALYVRVALPLDQVAARLAELRGIVWTAAVATGLAAMLLAFLVARRITRPLQDLSVGAERIAAGGYGHKVYAAGRDEVGALAATFNHMSGRLAEQFAQLEQDRRQLRAILSGMIEGVIALDAEERILFVNERAAQLLEFPTRAAAGRKLWEVVRRPALHEVVHAARTRAAPFQKEIHWTGPGARVLTVHAAPLAGAPAGGVILVLHDTTELRRLERVRQEFVANVSHELKTPLSVITACVETLLDGAVDDPAHRGPFLERIADQADRLHRLILDLLSLARIESESEVFEFEPVPLGPVVRACLERHRARAEAKNQRLEALFAANGQEVPVDAQTPPSSPPLTLPPCHLATLSDFTAWADEEAVSQILDNLVDNALKYTPAGGRIGVTCREEDRQVCLEVEDTGIGIAEADLPRIFERFYRVDRARSRELGGTGLGLSIVKHLVQAMHGSVQAVSQPGKGTRFTVRLPRPPAA
jgi:two-component system phosphate regulon sensor histidine kinase PhoR